MDSRAFLGLRPSHNPYRWSLEVGPGLVTRGGFLFAWRSRVLLLLADYEQL